MSDSKITISTNKAKLDLKMVHGFLSRSYWAEGRSINQIQASIDHSEAFGIYCDENQIGFARVLTDRAVFAYLMDVFIIPSHRRKGYATMLLRHILEFPDFAEVNTWALKTDDAHPLYASFGFSVVNDAEKWMMLVRND